MNRALWNESIQPPVSETMKLVFALTVVRRQQLLRAKLPPSFQQPQNIRSHSFEISPNRLSSRLKTFMIFVCVQASKCHPRHKNNKTNITALFWKL